MNTDSPNPPITASAERLTVPSEAWHAQPADAAATTVGGATAQGVVPADAAAHLPRRVPAPTSVIVPLDGSRFARRALPVAIHVARMLHADIHLLSAVATANYVEHRQTELAEIPSSPGCRVHRTVLVGLPPADAIHETRRRLQPGLVCMASHGRGPSARWPAPWPWTSSLADATPSSSSAPPSTVTWSVTASSHVLTPPRHPGR